jgi:transposase
MSSVSETLSPACGEEGVTAIVTSPGDGDMPEDAVALSMTGVSPTVSQAAKKKRSGSASRALRNRDVACITIDRLY